MHTITINAIYTCMTTALVVCLENITSLISVNLTVRLAVSNVPTIQGVRNVRLVILGQLANMFVRSTVKVVRAIKTMASVATVTFKDTGICSVTKMSI